MFSEKNFAPENLCQGKYGDVIDIVSSCLQFDYLQSYNLRETQNSFSIGPNITAVWIT